MQRPWLRGAAQGRLDQKQISAFTRTTAAGNCATSENGPGGDISRVQGTQKELRQKSNFPNPINAESTVQSGSQKYFA